MAIKPVKNFASTHAGAPAQTGQAGSRIAVLDACLVNGYNLITLDSLIVAGNVLTGTKAGHGFVVDQVIATTANETSLTGEWIVNSVTSNTFSAAAAGVANITGTGSLSAKAAPLGWTKVYSGTNKAVYKSTDLASCGALLRVDDTGTTTCRVVGYETMTDVDTGSGAFPTAALVTGGAYWIKSATADATARAWEIYGDSLEFLIHCSSAGSSGASFEGFGEYESEKPGDAFKAFLSGTPAIGSLTGYQYSSLASFSGLQGGSGLWFPRSFTQLGSCISGEVWAQRCSGGAIGSGDPNAGTTYPSPCTNGLVLTKPFFAESGTPRSLNIPGVYLTPQKKPLNNLDKITNVSGLPGRTLVALSAGVNISSFPSEGRVFIDITGPWR